MIKRLPGWVWGGGALLAAIAGIINVVGLLGVHHHGLTHLTGTASAIGQQLAAGSVAIAVTLATLIAAFTAGAMLSSIIVADTSLKLGHRYGFALLVESALLLIAIQLLSHNLIGGEHLLTAAAGLQNGLATTFSGAIVRTTHVTGIFTDVGTLLGHALRGQKLEKRKLSLLLAIAAGFFLGSWLGALLFQHLGYNTLYLPVTLTAAAGTANLVYRIRHGALPDQSV